jgi:molybdate transport system permease protein
MITDFFSPIRLSIEIASLSIIIVLILGIGLARFMANRHFKGKVLIETLILLPLVLPPTVVGFLLIVIFGKNSPVGELLEWIFKQPVIFSWWAAVIAATVVAFPFMYQSAKAGFEDVNEEIEEAARVDGAGEFRLFMMVSIPLALRSILSGGVLSFARALGEFGATIMFAGNIPGRTQTTPTAIYVALESGNMHMAWLWVASMIGISFVMLLCVHLIRGK